MPIRVHVSQLTNEQLLNKLGIKKRAKPRELERLEQVGVINWARGEEETHPVLQLLYAVPNGGKRNRRVAEKLKAEGVLPGVLDLCLPVARSGYHGLYIEMKHGDNKLSKPQSKFAQGVIAEGYCVAVCYSSKEATATLRWYIGMSPNKPGCVLN